MLKIGQRVRCEGERAGVTDDELMSEEYSLF